MVGRDPAFVVGLGTSGDSGAVSAFNGDSRGGIDLLGTAGGALGARTVLAAALGGEVRRDPDVVEEVDGAGEDSEEEEVEEDTVE